MKLMMLMAALLLSAGVTSGVWANPLPAQPHVYVEGSAELEVEPDMMTFTLSIQKSDLDLAKAKTDVDARSRLLIETVKKFGIKANDIATTALNIRPEYEYKDGQRVLTGNNVSRQVDINLRDLKKYPEMMKALVDAKISETINTNLTLADKKTVEEKVQTAAMNDAKARANRLAKSQGKTAGEPWSISEFNNRGNERWELTPNRELMGRSGVMKADASSLQRMASEPFEPGVMKITAQVYVVYLLK
ncbi:SIMPL domain-containing protein [Cellvibrio sp. OA-2007]|uniref:SIMPL domain-containing protein n=1 Tax=Cellvibrio sp. OA-2007 TaxID=529823 RepID=UPI000A0791E5|nr:SIMPL domain-containing protein [Cellvibrio sp. OA-2007]